MAIAKTVELHLASAGVDYETVAHPRTGSSSQTAEAAHVSGECLAKAVLLHREQDYLLAVAPSTHRIDLSAVGGEVRLATEQEIAQVFPDCGVGAVPPLGAAYGVPTMVDESLRNLPKIWFEAGDHEHVVGVVEDDFARLFGTARWARFSQHVQSGGEGSAAAAEGGET